VGFRQHPGHWRAIAPGLQLLHRGACTCARVRKRKAVRFPLKGRERLPLASPSNLRRPRPTRPGHPDRNPCWEGPFLSDMRERSKGVLPNPNAPRWHAYHERTSTEGCGLCRPEPRSTTAALTPRRGRPRRSHKPSAVRAAHPSAYPGSPASVEGQCIAQISVSWIEIAAARTFSAISNLSFEFEFPAQSGSRKAFLDPDTAIRYI